MEKFNSGEHLKMDPRAKENILKNNPDIVADGEYFIVPTTNDKGEIIKHYIPQRDKIDLKNKDGGISRISVERVIEATKEHPNLPLSESLKLLGFLEK